jgi:hypothetical protein
MRMPHIYSALVAPEPEGGFTVTFPGLNEAQLAARLGWAPKQVTHLFDGRHACRLGQIEAALAALGRRLVVSSEVVA